MKQEMMMIVSEMVERGYCLFSETVEQFVERMISYGFDADEMRRWRADFFRT